MQKPVSMKATGLSLLWCSLILTFIGILFIFTSSSINAAQSFQDLLYYPKRQIVTVIFGLLAIGLILRMPYHWIERSSFWFLLFTWLLLFATLVPGISHSANGASRWIRLASLQFQPAEIAKLSLIIFVSRNLTRKSAGGLAKIGQILPNLLPMLLFSPILMLQPDFGSTFLLGVLTFVLLFLAGLPWRYIVVTGMLAFAGIVAAILQAPYRLARLTSFLDPWAAAQSDGFQIIQSYLSFFNGGLFGLGLGASRQKLYFLPEAHTDFILSVIGEEMGFFGILAVISLYAYLTYLGFSIARQQSCGFRKFLASGLTCLIALQASINMGVAMGLLPTKGMTLPFVSNGSSSLIVFLIAAGLLAKTALETDRTHGQETQPP